MYGADGGVAFHVDNYGCRGGREAFLMDRAGRTLVGIRRRSCFGMFQRWNYGRHADTLNLSAMAAARRRGRRGLCCARGGGVAELP
jgi:hypothetical protein